MYQCIIMCIDITVRYLPEDINLVTAMNLSQNHMLSKCKTIQTTIKPKPLVLSEVQWLPYPHTDSQLTYSHKQFTLYIAVTIYQMVRSYCLSRDRAESSRAAHNSAFKNHPTDILRGENTFTE